MTRLQIYKKKKRLLSGLWGDQCLPTNPSLPIMCFHGQINTAANKIFMPNREMKLRGEWQCFVSGVTRSPRQLLLRHFLWILSLCSAGWARQHLIRATLEGAKWDYAPDERRKVPLTNKKLNSWAIKRILAQFTALGGFGCCLGCAQTHVLEWKKNSALSSIWMESVYRHRAASIQRPTATKHKVDWITLVYIDISNTQNTGKILCSKNSILKLVVETRYITHFRYDQITLCTD